MNRRIVAFVAILCALVCSPLMPLTASANAWQDVYIRTWTPEGGLVTTACYQLANFSNVGCDDNHDGSVRFQHVPEGPYTVLYMGGADGYTVASFPIMVDNSTLTWEAYAQPTSTIPAPSTGVTENVRIASRDPKDGRLLTGACYVIGTYSNEGCDENLDGVVTFDAIPLGQYTLTQTRAPQGYPGIDPFPIQVSDVTGPQTITVSQQPAQPAGTVTLSLVFVDPVTGQRVVDPNLCATVGSSYEGCDNEPVDGQIDFLNMPMGTYTVHVTNAPAGYASNAEFTVRYSATGQRSVIVELQLPRS